MHEALREVLGTHVEQKGSYVSPEILRFDFSHFQKMTPEEIRAVEQNVTEKIRSNFTIEEHRHVPIDEARAQGAMALFGEKYGDDVRTVRFGSSIELCGGTHISSTGRIGTFRIVSESAIAAGVRRIEAVTAKGCEDYLYTMEDMLRNIKEALSGNAPEIMVGLRKLMSENEEMRQKIEAFTKERTVQLKNLIIQKKEIVNGVTVFKLEGMVVTPEIVKDIAFQLRGEFPEYMAFMAATGGNNKPSLTVMLSDDLVSGGLNAGTIVREAAKHIQGGGGGQPHFATAGGKNADGLKMAMETMLQYLP